MESGDNGNPRFQRIFKARVEDNRVRIIDVTPWPVSIHNVEATAVAALGDRFVFLFAERAQNLSSTDLRWAVFDPEDSFLRSVPVGGIFQSRSHGVQPAAGRNGSRQQWPDLYLLSF